MIRSTRNSIYLIIIIIIANIISCFLFIRWDFTMTKRYSLSKVSKNIIANNQQPIVVDFYTSPDLPQDILKIAKEFHFLLKEYQSLSNSSFIINTISVNSNTDGLAAIRAGIEPIYKEIRERDQEKIQRFFLGAIFHIGTQETILPRINHDTPIEYEITRLLKQAADTIKPTIGFIRGHGETQFGNMPQFITELANLTEIHTIDLHTTLAPDSINVLCIINPQEFYSASEINYLEDYLSKGGRLFIALNHAIGQLDGRNSGFINRTGLEDMLEKKGAKIRYDFIIDNNCGSIAIHQRYGLIDFQSNISFPYIPMITNFSNHTITYGLKSLLLPFASSIEKIKTSENYIFTPLARSSAISGTQQAPIFFDLQKQWKQSDFNHPHNIVAALLTNPENNSSIIAITDADFVNENIVSSGPTDNINFAINSIEWLADNSGLIQLRNKFTTFSLLEPISEHTREFLKYLNFILPIALTLLFLLLHYRKQKKQRNKRSKPSFDFTDKPFKPVI